MDNQDRIYYTFDPKTGKSTSSKEKPTTTSLTPSRRVVQLPPIKPGYERGFCKCKECGTPAFKDFIPYSLSNPLMALPCGHPITSHPSNHIDHISKDEAIKIWLGKGWPVIDNTLPTPAPEHPQSYFHGE